MEGMARIDLLAAALAVLFVKDVELNGAYWPLLDAVALTVSNYSAFIFGYPTRTSGAWDEHPTAY